MAHERTAVGIVGAGPAGLLLGHLLQRAGINSITVEIRSERHVIDRVRAGVLEQTSVDLLHEVGLGERLSRRRCGTRACTLRSTGHAIDSI